MKGLIVATEPLKKHTYLIKMTNCLEFVPPFSRDQCVYSSLHTDVKKLLHYHFYAT